MNPWNASSRMRGDVTEIDASARECQDVGTMNRRIVELEDEEGYVWWQKVLCSMDAPWSRLGNNP